MTDFGLHYPGEPCDLCDADTGPEACPGDCNRVWVAAERIAHDEAQKPRPRLDLVRHDTPMIEAAPTWCRPCQEHITSKIADFPGLCTDLTPGSLNTPRDTQTGSHSAVNPPSPSPAWDQADEIIRWAVNTEDQLRAHIGDYGRGGQRPWRDLGSAVSYLTLHTTPLLSCPDAVSIGFDALRMHRRLTQVTGSDLLTHRLPGACMVCDRRSLQRKDGDDLVECRACGATWDIEYYGFLARASAEAVRVG